MVITTFPIQTSPFSSYWGTLNVIDYGAVGNGIANDTQAFIDCINACNTLAASATPKIVYVPAGFYLVDAGQLPTFLISGGIVGAGHLKTTIILNQATSGILFSWSENWYFQQYPYNGDTVDWANQKAGPIAKGITVIGNRTCSGQQHAFTFYDRNDAIWMEDVECYFLKGSAIRTGVLLSKTDSYIRESWFSHLRFFNCGDTGYPVLDFNAVGTGPSNNEINYSHIDIYAPYDTGIKFRNNSSGSYGLHRLLQIRVEGLENNPTGLTTDLIQIGDATQTGAAVQNIQIYEVELSDCYAGGAAIHLTAQDAAHKPFNVVVTGHIGGGNPGGYGVWLEAGRDSFFKLSDIHTNDTNIVIGASPFIGTNIIFDLNNNQAGYTYSIDSSSVTAIKRPLWTSLTPAGATVLALNANTINGGPPADSTIVGGNTRGGGAVDLQIAVRTSATQIAGGQGSALIGGAFNVISSGGVNSGGVAGFNNSLTGSHSGFLPGSRQGNDRARYGGRVNSSGEFTQQGDAQSSVFILRATVSDTSTVVLTADATAAGSANCVNIGDAMCFNIEIKLTAINNSVTGSSYCANWGGSVVHTLERDSGAASTLFDGGSSPVAPDGNKARGSTTGISVTAAPDTTNGGLALSFTGPTGNADTWHIVAEVMTREVH